MYTTDLLADRVRELRAAGRATTSRQRMPRSPARVLTRVRRLRARAR